MKDYNFEDAFDGVRLTSKMRACVHADGKLCFTPEVAKVLGITIEKVLLICPKGPKDFAVVVLPKGTPKGFRVMRVGAYHVVHLKTLFLELGIEFEKNTVVFDIIEMDDTYQGATVYKFNRRIIKHEFSVSTSGGVLQGADRKENRDNEGSLYSDANTTEGD